MDFLQHQPLSVVPKSIHLSLIIEFYTAKVHECYCKCVQLFRVIGYLHQ